jgi:hypothetical protein
MPRHQLEDYVTQSFAKIDSEIHDILVKGERPPEALLLAALGGLHGVLTTLAKRLDEMAP